MDCVLPNFIKCSFADKLAHVFRTEKSELRKSCFVCTGDMGRVGAGGGRKGAGGQDTTVLSFLSFLNPEIPEGIFSGDKCKFWSHSSGV